MEELNLTSTDIIGFCAAILTTLAFLPQLIRTWKTKCAKELTNFFVTFEANRNHKISPSLIVNMK